MKQEEPKQHDQSREVIVSSPTGSAELCPPDCSGAVKRKMVRRAGRPDLLEGELTGKIIAAFYTVYNTFGFGFLESVYANARTIELRARGLRVEREAPVEVYYRGELVGRFRLDLVVEAKVSLECKATDQLGAGVRPQMFNYLRSSTYPLALLLHFGVRPKHFRYIRPDVLKQLARQYYNSSEEGQ